MGTRLLKRKRANRTAGAIYVEFLVVFPIMLFFFLSLLQLAQIYVANLAVEHAATRASRAAIVILPDDPAYYDGQAQNQVNPEVYAASSIPGDIGTIIEVIVALTGDRSDRMSEIRRAAWVPLIAISPSLESALGDYTVENALKSGLTKVAASALYASASTAVTFYDEPRSTDMAWEFDAHQQITTRVTHLFYCSVPLARMVICDELGDVESEEAVRAELSQTSGRILSLWTGRFRALRAEATMPNQGGAFVYQ